MPPTTKSHKKALIIGINYSGTPHQLSGCIADAHRMRDFLIQRRGYESDPAHMVVMTDDAPDEHHRPTYKNMLAAFQWLVHGNESGDSLFMHYSGHGALIHTPNSKTEYEDTIVPVDYATAGHIEADLLHRCLVRALPHDIKLTVVLDCCHSGTMLELPYTYHPNEDGGELNKREAVKRAEQKVLHDLQVFFHGGFKGTKKSTPSEILQDVNSIAHLFTHRAGVDALGYKHEHFSVTDEDEAANGREAVYKNVFVISGCRDDQTSADTKIAGFGNTGALTFSVMTKLKEEDMQDVSFAELLHHIRAFMAKNNLTQTPQLSCGVEVDPRAPFEF